jgi:hypothetical protein
MLPARLKTCAAVLAAAIILTACATEVKVAPAAVLDITGKPCGEQIDLMSAKPLAPKKAQKWVDMFEPVGAESACARIGDMLVNYAVFELPPNGSNHVITVGGLKQERRTLAPRVFLLDFQGQVLRSFEDKHYKNIGSSFAVQFRPSEEDRYLLVQTDPSRVGQVADAFEQKVVTGSGYVSTPTGGASYTTTSGVERSMSRTFSHEGIIAIRVQALSGKIGAPAG